MSNIIKYCVPFGVLPTCTFYKQPIHYQLGGGHQNVKATFIIEI